MSIKLQFAKLSSPLPYRRRFWEGILEDHSGRSLWETILGEHLGRAFRETILGGHSERTFWQATANCVFNPVVKGFLTLYLSNKAL